MITVPDQSTKAWSQANESDLFGNIHSTKNITFDEKGYLRLSYSSRAVMNEDINANFDEAAAIIRSQDFGYFVVTHDQCFECDDSRFLSTRPTQVVIAGTPSGDLQSDCIFASALMIVTQDTDVDYYDPAANTWTDTNITLTATSQSQHPAVKFLSLGAVAIADVNTVKLYTSPLTATPVLIATLTIFADYYITSLAYYNQNLYIGTMDRYGGRAVMYIWNGYGTAAQSVYEVESNIIYDTHIFDQSVCCFTGAGQLLRFTGSGFSQLGALPTYYLRRSMSDETNINMYHNCLKSQGNLLYVAINNSENTRVLTNQPEGIWCYDKALDIFYHRYSFSNSLTVLDTILTSAVDTATDIITVAAAPVTGTEILYDAVSGTALAPLLDDKKYYVIKLSATTIKLATTFANALAGTAIDLTGTGNNVQKLTAFPNYDFGQYKIGRNAAIHAIERVVTKPQYGCDVIWGGTVYQKTNSVSQGYFGSVSSAVETRGYFVTPKIYSSNVQDMFNLFTIKFSPFVSDINKIIVKYRTEDDMRSFVEINGATTDWYATWTSSTTFTSPEPELANAAVGDEVEFIRGAAAGMLCHITAITSNAGVYTVTIDETYYNYASGDFSNFMFRNWTKWQTITYGDKNATQAFLSTQLGKKGKFIQFKVELRGVQIRIEELAIDNLYKLSSVKSRGDIIS